jgi:hypothetical protein
MSNRKKHDTTDNFIWLNVLEVKSPTQPFMIFNCGGWEFSITEQAEDGTTRVLYEGDNADWGVRGDYTTLVDTESFKRVILEVENRRLPALLGINFFPKSKKDGLEFIVAAKKPEQVLARYDNSSKKDVTNE